MFFHRVISKIFESGEEWPHWWITGLPTAASGQGVGLPAASSDSAAPPQASSQSAEVAPCVEISWPKFKVRRLVATHAGFDAIGPNPSAYKLMEKLGAGRYGSVWASRLGGHELAIKVFKCGKEKRAVYEASIAGGLAHPKCGSIVGCCV